jgi:N,N'-diacetyllegionaminate synthase
MYIIAEFGNMHEGSVQLAKKFIEVGRDLGVDCVKFQAHYFHKESLLDAPSPSYFKSESRESYFSRTSFTCEQWRELKLFSDSIGVDFMVSPFSEYAVDVLLEAGITRMKIASGEVSNLPLLEYINDRADEIFLSSGMSSFIDIQKAVEVLNNPSLKRRVLFQCSSIYPCPPDKIGINVLSGFKEIFPHWEIGLSDHSISSVAGILAINSPCSVIEKHLTLSNLMYGSDAQNSLEPGPFGLFVKNIREAEVIMNSPIDKDAEVETLGHMKNVFEKSIVYKRDIQKFKIISLEDLAFKKPGNGVPASLYKDFIGKTITRDVKENQKLSETDFV